MTPLSTEPDATAPPVSRCEECAVYMTRRAHVLAPAIVVEALALDVAPPKVALDYLAKVHARHTAGLSLDVVTTCANGEPACRGCSHEGSCILAEATP